ncbi:HNH endonuclease [Falsiroseomonas sp. HW251]|uniref:HNH endonuclease n=1 Tax=Falsiroseomonas sp. HW251 TaxID=3390998 RepID=UPI003D311015
MAILLRVDDPTASRFNLADADAHDGERVTFTGMDGIAYGRATIQAVAPHVAELVDREPLDEQDRYRIRSGAALEARAIRVRETEQRPEQAAFRQRVGEAWGWRCAITGEDVPEVLEAAHLPGASWRTGDNEATDGVLLRADLHRLFDAGLLQIEDGKVRVTAGSYAALDGVRLRAGAEKGGRFR